MWWYILGTMVVWSFAVTPWGVQRFRVNTMGGGELFWFFVLLAIAWVPFCAFMLLLTAMVGLGKLAGQLRELMRG